MLPRCLLPVPEEGRLIPDYCLHHLLTLAGSLSLKHVVVNTHLQATFDSWLNAWLVSRFKSALAHLSLQRLWSMVSVSRLETLPPNPTPTPIPTLFMKY